MSIKSDRQQAIRRIIAENEVKSQDELQSILNSAGFFATQATLSRDFREMNVVKIHDSSKGYVYKISGESGNFSHSSPDNITKDGIRSIEFSSSFAVIKTQPGFASAVATIIDHNLAYEIVGTLAGDDTVLLVIKEGCDRQEVLSSISRFISGIQSKLV